MGPEKSLFTMALGLEAPWYVDDVRFDATTKQIDFEVAFKPGSRMRISVPVALNVFPNVFT